MCITCAAQSFQFSCLCTLHEIKDLPQHRAGESSIRHLRHKQPNTQPVKGPQMINIGIVFNQNRNQGWFLTFCFEGHVKQLWGRNGRTPAVAFPRTWSVKQIHQYRLSSRTQPSDHWHSTLSFWGKRETVWWFMLNTLYMSFYCRCTSLIMRPIRLTSCL